MPVRFIVRSTLLAACLLFVTACSLISDRSAEYKTAAEGQTIVVPESLSGRKLRERYSIPDIDSPTVPDGEYSLPTPPDATASLSDDPYTIKTFEGDSWLELSMPPSKAWPLIDSFWISYGIGTHTKEVSDGYFGVEELVESAPHQDFIAALEKTSHQPVVIEGMAFQARLTQGVRRNTSELQVRAFLPNADASTKKTWQAKAVTPRIERALLELIGEDVTSEGSDARYSLNAVNIGDESLVHILDDEAGYPYLQIRLRFKRAWAEVLDALEASPVIVSGTLRDEGIVYISYLDEEEIDSWYTLESQLEDLKKQRNFELKFYAKEPELIDIRARIISDIPEPEQIRELIELVFEHIS